MNIRACEDQIHGRHRPINPFGVSWRGEKNDAQSSSTSTCCFGRKKDKNKKKYVAAVGPTVHAGTW